MVVLARAARTLAEQMSWRGFFEFSVIFGMLWMAWMFGTIYHEFHGRDDGRPRLFVFLQMLILALLAVFTGEAAGQSGPAFAVNYSAFLVVLIWLWQRVRRRDTKEFMEAAGRYQAGMWGSVVVIAISAGLPDDLRMLVWCLFVVSWIVGVGGAYLSPSSRFRLGVTATHSLAERFGLFVIIVLGEVVVGVVDGLSKVGQSPRSIATGMLGLMVGFAYWWTYFDFVGRRLPRDSGPSLAGWIYGHLPVTLSIAAAGAAMVSLVEHAEDQRAPIAAAWLLAGAVAIGLLGLVLENHAGLQTSEVAVPTRLRGYEHCSGCRTARWMVATCTLATRSDSHSRPRRHLVVRCRSLAAIRGIRPRWPRAGTVRSRTR